MERQNGFAVVAHDATGDPLGMVDVYVPVSADLEAVTRLQMAALALIVQQYPGAHQVEMRQTGEVRP